ncbi:hypothetical protein J3E74DRAFT_286236 [Bipolaris maydis]|nr:hypothetical protein J3E74DRAFT_286236 [Bipolaris maydis]
MPDRDACLPRATGSALPTCYRVLPVSEAPPPLCKRLPATPTLLLLIASPPLPPPQPASTTRPGTPVVSPGQTDFQRQLPSGLHRLPEAMRWTRPMAAAAPARAYPIC